MATTLKDWPTSWLCVGISRVQRLTSSAAQTQCRTPGHSTALPVLGPDRRSGFPAPTFYRRSLPTDLGAMAQRAGAKYRMLTHLAPSLRTARHNRWDVPGGPLTEADCRRAVEEGGFTGK